MDVNRKTEWNGTHGSRLLSVNTEKYMCNMDSVIDFYETGIFWMRISGSTIWLSEVNMEVDISEKDLCPRLVDIPKVHPRCQLGVSLKK